MSKAGRNAALKVPATKAEAAPGRPEFGVSSALPALSVCRLEAPEDLLRKLRQHVDDPALADFSCPICWDPFWQPVRTVCGHAFCEGCLLKAVLAQLNHQQPDVSCPLCRHPLHVDDVAVDQALLTRIRSVLTEKDKENVCVPRRSSGRVHRGLVAATHPTSGPSAANFHPSSSSTTAPSPCLQRPRTREGAVSSSLGVGDLDGLAVRAGPTISGNSSGARVQTPHRGVPLRGPPRTAPTISRSNEEGLDGLLPNGWLRVSASSPCGGRPCSRGRPGTSPAAPISAREATAYPQRPPSTAPEEELGSLTVGTPRRSEVVQKCSTGRPGMRASSLIGGSLPQGDSVSRPSTSNAIAPPVRRCGWGPTAPAVTSKQAAIEIANGGNATAQTERRGVGLRNSRPVRHKRKTPRASGASSTPVPQPPDVGKQAVAQKHPQTAPSGSATTALEATQVSLSSALMVSENQDMCETEAEPFDQSAPDTSPHNGARFNATAWAEAVPLPSVVRSPPTGAPPSLSFGISDTGTMTSGSPPRVDETGLGSSTSQATPHIGNQSRSARASCTSSSTGRQSILQARRSSAGSTHNGNAESNGLMSRFLNSAAGALSAAVGWSTTASSGERGGQRLSQQNGFSVTHSPCSHSANYAADFAFADRYRQLLEEGA